MWTVAALYQFARFEDPAALKPPLEALCRAHGVTGTLLLAPEGINGTIAGTPEAIREITSHIKRLPGCADLEWKEAQSAEQNRACIDALREVLATVPAQVDSQPGSPR